MRSRALAKVVVPSSVKLTCRVVRRKTSKPSRASSRATERLKDEGATPSLRAASAKPPSSATAMNAVISFRSANSCACGNGASSFVRFFERSLFGLGVIIGAPVLTALTGKLPRKTLLLSLLALFTAGNLLAAFAPSYPALVTARFITGLAHGVFFAIASTILTKLVPKDKESSAIAVEQMGLQSAPFVGAAIVVIGIFLVRWSGSLERKATGREVAHERA